MQVLTDKPEGGNFGRGGRKNGLWKSICATVGDPDRHHCGEGQVLGGK